MILECLEEQMVRTKYLLAAAVMYYGLWMEDKQDRYGFSLMENKS